DWSYELLPDEERRLLRRVAVFPAGFTLLAAIAVVSDVGEAPLSVVNGIANLVAKSLVTLDGSVSARRWRLLETIRAYALEKLADSHETKRAPRLSTEFFQKMFRPAARGPQDRSDADIRVVSPRDIDNVRAAIDWALSPRGDLSAGLELTA